MVKNHLAVQEMQARSVGWEDVLEEEIANHSNIFFAWKIPGTEGPGKLQSMRSQRVRCNLATEQTCIHVHTKIFPVGMHSLSVFLVHFSGTLVETYMRTMKFSIYGNSTTIMLWVFLALKIYKSPTLCSLTF